MKTQYLWLICAVFGFAACGGSTSDSSVESETTGLALTATADFDTSAAASLAAALSRYTTTETCADVAGSDSQDGPTEADGLDCDGDGGIVAHATPSRYKLAFKRITLMPTDVEGEDAEAIELLPDTGTLALSEVVDFTSADNSQTILTLDPEDLAPGSYDGLDVELYYFEMTFPIGGTDRNVRIYMSDDDFAAEGSLGHHQGDITLIDDDGVELGWIDSTWSDSVTDTRSEAQNGAGGLDDETGHERGFFGNAEFWDAAELAQGASQDIYTLTMPLDAIEIPAVSEIDTLTTITATFSVADTFFYEDFSPQGTGFSPDAGGEATAESTAWAPLLPGMAVDVTTE